MAAEVRVATGRHTPEAYRHFDFEKLDAFHSEEVLRAIYGLDWRSILILDSDRAFLHAFARNPIPGTPWFDIEPLFGYAGPVLNCADRGFAAEALELYRAHCRAESVVAELVRFSPLLDNARAFAPHMRVEAAKEIVIMRCHQSDAEQLRSLSASGARDVRQRDPRCIFRPIAGESEWAQAVELYRRSIRRLAAQPQWSMPDEFFCRLARSTRVRAYGVWVDERLTSTAFVVHHALAAYYLLAANESDAPRGASKYLVFGTARACADHMCPWLILGGGNSRDADDSLLAFKRKFSTATCRFHIGKIVHVPDAFEALCAAARASAGGIDDSMFLQYRWRQPQRTPA